MKAREFWIDDSHPDEKMILKSPDNWEMHCWSKPIHVIEYSAYDELRRQNEVMREALEFYADIANWYSEEHYRSLTCINNDYTTHKNGYGLAGKRAREALAKCGKGGSV